MTSVMYGTAFKAADLIDIYTKVLSFVITVQITILTAFCKL